MILLPVWALFHCKRMYGAIYGKMDMSLKGACPVKGELGLESYGMRDDLEIFEAPHGGIAQGVGMNWFRKGDAAILIRPDLYGAEPEGCRFAVRHEVCHILCNDVFKRPLVPLVVAALLVAVVSVNFFSAIAIIVVAEALRVIYTRFLEIRADRFAIAESTREELIGGRRLLLALRQARWEEKMSMWRQLHHPSIQSRIERIEEALGMKPVESEEKIARLVLALKL